MTNYIIGIENLFRIEAESEEEAYKQIHKEYVGPADLELKTIEVEEEQIETITVRFYPQVWDRNDHALTGAPATFEVPKDEATVEGELVEDSSYDSDQLKGHENAPEWVRGWTGPFFVEVED